MGSMNKKMMLKGLFIFFLQTQIFSVLTTEEGSRSQKSICGELCQDAEDGLVSTGCCPNFSCLCHGGTGFAITCKCPDCGFCASAQTCIAMERCREGEGCCPGSQLDSIGPEHDPWL